jgi:hypothetical protein
MKYLESIYVFVLSLGLFFWQGFFAIDFALLLTEYVPSDDVVIPNQREFSEQLWINNNSKSVNHIFKRAIDWKPQTTPDLVNKLHNCMRNQFLHLGPFGQQTWPLLLKIEHMVKLHVFGNNSKTVNNIRNLTG